MTVLDRAAPPPDLTVPYGPLAEHVVDFRLPRNLPAPRWLCAEWNLGAGANLMGGMPDEVPERYAVADPAALPPPPVPVTVVHGTADDGVPVNMSRAFPAGRLTEIAGAGHFDVTDPRSEAWPHVLAALAGTEA